MTTKLTIPKPIGHYKTLAAYPDGFVDVPIYGYKEIENWPTPQVLTEAYSDLIWINLPKSDITLY